MSEHQNYVLKGLKYNIMSPEEIRSIGVVEVVNHDLCDSEGTPIPGGIFDISLGAIFPYETCSYCGKDYNSCYGHFGYINLAEPVVNPNFITPLKKVLETTCASCGCLLASKAMVAKKTPNCPSCKKEVKKFRVIKPYFFVDALTLELIPNREIRERLTRVSRETLDELGLFYNSRPEWAVLTVLPVMPRRTRATIILENNTYSHDDLTYRLSDIVAINNKLLKQTEKEKQVYLDLVNLLQYNVSTYFNNGLPNIPAAKHISGKYIKSIVERIKGKEGIFRHNLVGKRTNHCARATISPGPDLKINQVGVPIEIVKELYLPVVVTEENMSEMKNLIDSFPQYPCALYINIDKKRYKVLETNKEFLKEAIAVHSVVDRQLINGDLAIVNRQPTLHKLSALAHEIVVKPGKTISLHPLVCIGYNADFDGDEMNLHILHDQVAQVEATELMSLENNLMSPKYGKTLYGIIEGPLAGLFYLTNSDRKYRLNQIVELTKNTEFDFLTLKKEMTGSELFSLFLPAKLDFKTKNLTNNDLVIEAGQLLKGSVDKKIIGVEGGVLNTYLFQVYGPAIALKFLNNLFSLGLNAVNLIGITSNIHEYHLPDQIKAKVDKILKDNLSHFEQGDYQEYNLAKAKIGSILSESLSKNKDSNLFIMSQSGARGSLANYLQMSATVGQQAIDQKTLKISHQVKPFFESDVMTKDAESQGIILNNYLDGLNERECFVEGIAGRSGLIDTQFRTAKSGYTARKLISALQEICVYPDHSVRDNQGKLIQYEYGSNKLSVDYPYDANLLNIEKWIEVAEEDVDLNLSSKEIIKHLSKCEVGTFEKSFLEHFQAFCVRKSLKLEVINNLINELPLIYEQYFVNVLEPVGIIAAQSIGEASTQLSLRGLHFTGSTEIEIASGLERIIDLVDVTKKTKNNYIFMKVEDTSSAYLDKVKSLVDQNRYGFFEEYCTVNTDYRNYLIIKMNSPVILPKMELIFKKFKVETVVKGEEEVEVMIKELALVEIHVLLNALKVCHTDGLFDLRNCKFVRNEEGQPIEYVLSLYNNMNTISDFIQKNNLKIRLTCNNLLKTQKELGLEAARNLFIDEISNTVRSQGLEVHSNHFELLADAMTRSGTFLSVGRRGVVKSKASALAKASFETATSVLFNAAIEGSKDVFKGVFENLIVGKLPFIGTNKVKLSINLDKL